MKEQRRGERILLLVIVGLAMAALAILYLTAPPPTVLVVHVVDAGTGAPLSGAQVEAGPRNGQPLPVVLADDTGVARFENAPSDPAYRIRVQKVDYDLASEQAVAVAEGQSTEVAVPLTPHGGGRLFVGLDRARIAQIDTASLLAVQTLVLPAGPEALVRRLRLHPDRDLLYAATGSQGYILDSRTGAVLGQLAIEGTIESLDLSADGQYLLVSSTQDGYASGMLSLVHLLILDAGTGQVVTDTRLADADLVTPVAWEPTGSRLEVLKVVSGGWASLGYVPVRSTLSRNGAVLSADGQYLFTWFRAYSSERDGMFDMLTLIRTEDGATMDEEFPLGTTALAASPTKQELYVLNGDMGTLTILDWSSSGARTLVAVGKDPESLGVTGDGTWAYVANQGSQTISAVHLASANVVSTVPLPGKPLSVAVR